MILNPSCHYQTNASNEAGALLIVIIGCHKGPSINDVTLEGGRGVQELPILRTNSTDRLRECVTKGGGRGSKNLKNMHDIIYVWSLRLQLVVDLSENIWEPPSS